MTLAEYFAWVKAWKWRDNEQWIKLAQHASWLMNVWLPKGVFLTPEKLLGPKFMKDVIPEEFKTKEEWEKHKAGIQHMAKYYARIYREVKSGKRKPVKVISFGKGQQPRSK